MEKLYHLWIRIKYQYYKLYWKIYPPKLKHLIGFYGWQEVNYNVLNKEGIACGIMKEL